MSLPVRIVLDTNVLVSAIVFGGLPGRVVDAARDGTMTGIVSLHTLNELRIVLTRPRFGVEADLADVLAEEILQFCEVAPVERALGVWGPDPDDDPVIETALSVGARFVVTGDAHLLGLKVAGLRFVTPSEMLTTFGL
jgi:putative PIN family toxin of toxin-antitoxin system